MFLPKIPSEYMIVLSTDKCEDRIVISYSHKLKDFTQYQALLSNFKDKTLYTPIQWYSVVTCPRQSYFTDAGSYTL